MARSAIISLSIAGPIAPLTSTNSTSVSRRDTINGVQDATAVPGTEPIIPGLLTSKSARPRQTTCFSDKGQGHCYGISHHWFSTANHAFCTKVNGLVFDMAHTNTSVNMTYLYQPLSEASSKGEIQYPAPAQ